MSRLDRIKKLVDRLNAVKCNPWSHMTVDVMAKFLLPDEKEVEIMEQVVSEIENKGCDCLHQANA